MIERVIRTPKDQCVHRHRFETLQHASQVISDWISFYNNGDRHRRSCCARRAGWTSVIQIQANRGRRVSPGGSCQTEARGFVAAKESE